MAMQTTSSAGLTGQYQVYFSKKLLDHAVELTVLDQFAAKYPFPKNHGATQMRFFRPDVGAASNVQTLSEGVPISTFRDTTLTAITATMSQYGEAVKISDILSMTDLFDQLNISTDSMGEDAALHAELIMNTAVVPNVAAANKHYSGGAATFAALVALTAAQGAMTLTDFLWAMTKLTLTRAPYAKGGEYVAVVPPQLAFDLMQDAKFVNASLYGATTSLYKGELGKWYGIRIVQTTTPWIEGATEGTYSAAGNIYSTIVLGGNSFATPIMAGNSPYSPKVIINDRPDKSDPLNQFITAGWKAYWCAVVLNNNWFVVNRSKTTFA